MLLFGTILFGDKFGTAIHWNFLPLLCDVSSIGEFSWESACLAHLYKSLCKTSRFDWKKVDGPLILLLTWPWIRLPFLTLIPVNPWFFLLANSWHNWERTDRLYRFHSLAHFRKSLDKL
ncbi:hypothetical protein Ahy_B01g053823 [Arachis hypogaea]|uniref:Aminotransferase-like plant mobile domain-containing protein n=1 Tax=Arachis hypogaea TaxID=3818 RepID=A0A445ASN9_ARAHY|nr:hypothetical protein Ahy_B01g053823 [Arachis hypogaea]